MKKVFLAVALFIGIGAVSAQQKIGYIATDELMQSMPEITKINADLQDYQKSLGGQYDSYVADFHAKDSAFAKDSSKLTPSMREIKRNEIFELYQKVSTWQQQAQELYNQKVQEKLAPVRSRVLDAIRSVAKENGYGYVMDINTLIVYPPADDLGRLVRKKLGIAERATTTPARGK